MKRFLIILLTIGIISCKSTVYIKPDITVPDFKAIRPERPIIEDGSTTLQGLLIVGRYARQLEAYSDGLEEYIESIGAILNDTEN